MLNHSSAGGRGIVVGDSGTKLSMTKCKIIVPNQCISCTAGLVIANHCEFVCSGIAVRGSSVNSSFDIANSTFNLETDSSMGISSSHGHKTSLCDCSFVNGMCGMMTDSEAICEIKNTNFTGCKFGCRSRDSILKLSNCKMHDCQKCVYSFGSKGKVHAKDSRFEKIAHNCFECVSESCIVLERCTIENSANCVIKATACGNMSLTDCKFENCNAKVSVATGGSTIKIASCHFNSLSGNGFDFNDNSVGILENVIFQCCSGIGIQLKDSKLYMVSSHMSTILSHCVLCNSGSSIEASRCLFEFYNGFSIAQELIDGTIVSVANSLEFNNVKAIDCFFQ